MIFNAIFEPIPKATLLLIIGNSQNCFHDHELDRFFKIQGPRSKFQVLEWTLWYNFVGLSWN